MDKSPRYINLTTLDAVKRQTDKAVLVELLNKREGKIVEIWLPKSQLSDYTLDALEETGLVASGIPAWGVKIEVSRWILECKSKELGDWVLDLIAEAEDGAEDRAESE